MSNRGCILADADMEPAMTLRAMKRATIIKHSLAINARVTRISLEDGFWEALKKIAVERRLTVSTLVSEIDGNRREGNRSSALRVYVLQYYQERTHTGQ
jgi:predicted DNA-binding ribbon-helix-helix protein